MEVSSLIRSDGEAGRGDAKSALVEVGRSVVGDVVCDRVLVIGASNCCKVL